MNVNGSKSRFEDDALDNMVFVFPFLSLGLAQKFNYYLIY